VVEIGIFRREIPLAPPEDDLALKLELLEYTTKGASSLGSAEPTLVHDLGYEHGKVHTAPAAPADGSEYGLGIEISRDWFRHRGND